LYHFPRRRIASAVSRFHGKAHEFWALTAQASGFFTFNRHADFRLWDALFAEWTSQYGGLCVCHIDRSAIRRTNHGRAFDFGALPGPLALLFPIEDSASWLWTLLTSRAERRLN
jgi:hypothetical protein